MVGTETRLYEPIAFSGRPHHPLIIQAEKGSEAMFVLFNLNASESVAYGKVLAC